LQRAISRDGKACERVEKRVARTEARRIARESLTREKAERARLREEKRALREVEATKRRREVEEHRAQRLQQKETQVAAKISKKRSLKENALNRPAKTIPLTTYHRRHTGDTYEQLSQVDRAANGDSGPSVSEGKVQEPPIGTQTQIEGAFVQHARSGRIVRLPTRFR
jgi:hypothetical protein